MDHHYHRHPNHHSNHQHHPPRQHHPQLMDSSSSRYFPLRPPPPPPSFPDDHTNLFPPPQRHLPPPPPLPNHHPLSPRLLHHLPPPPLRPPPPPPSPPHHHPYLHHRRIVDDDHHRRDAFRSPSRSMIYDHHQQQQQQQHQHHNLGEIDRRPRFRLSELPPPPQPLHPPPAPPPLRVPVPPHSPIAHRSPPQFVQFDRIRRQIDSPPRFREDLNLKIDSRARVHPDTIEFHQLRCERDRVDANRRVWGVFDRLEGDFDRERDRDCDRDRHERYYPEMLPRKEFELNSGSSECRLGPVNDEIVLEENVNVRRSSGGNGGGSREVSQSPIKFRIGGVEVDDGKGNRGRKEEVQEYNNRCTPKKSVQKKSAFLRIQPGKPPQQQQHHSSSSSSFRNRFDNSISSNKTPSPLKGKESSSEGLDRRVSEERVRSSVELDVCFKSTGLVAKPVMAAAPSCSGVDFNVSNTLSDSGIRIHGEGSSNSSSVFKREEKGFKNRVRVSPIMKRLGIQKNVGVRGSDSESPSGGSGGLSVGITSDKTPKGGGVLVTDDKKAGHDHVSSHKVVRKKRKANSPLSRLSRPVSTKTGSRLVNVDHSPGHPSDSSMPSDIPVKQSEELSSGGNVTDSSQNVFVGTDKTDVCKTPTVVDQEEVLGHSVTEASVSKRIRDSGASEYFPGSPGSLGTGLCESHWNKPGFLQDEQRISSVDEGVTSSVDKCSSDICIEKESAKGQDKDMIPMLVNNSAEEGSSELMICGGDNVDGNDCRGNVVTLNSVAVLNSISIPADLSNSRENKDGITCPVDDADKPCEPRVFSSPENAANSLSLGGLYLDKDYESESRYSEDYAKVESLSIDVTSDKRTPLIFEDDVTIGLKHINHVSDVLVTNDIQDQQCQGSDAMLVSSDTTLGREENITSCIISEGVLACPGEKIVSLLNRKRKVRTEPDSLDLRISEPCHDSAVSLSFPVESAMVPVEEHSSAVSGSPCVDLDVLRGNEFTGHWIKGKSSKNHDNDSDPIDHFSSCDKKRKTFLLDSVFPDAPVSKSSDVPASIKTLMPLTDGPSSNLSPQLVEGFELHKSGTTGKDAVDGATSNLSAEPCSFADNSISGFLCIDSFFSESASPGTEQSDLSESGGHQKVDGNLMMAIANDEVGLIALESACRMAANDRKSDLQCLRADHSGDEEQEPMAMNMDCDGTSAVNASLPSFSGYLHSCDESYSGEVTTNSNLLNTPSNMCSLSSSPLDESIVNSSIYVSSGDKPSKDDKKLNQPFATQSSFTSPTNLLPQGHKNNLKPSNVASLGVKSFAQKSVPFPSKLVKTTTSSSNSMIRQRKNVLTRSEASPSTSRLSSVVNPSNRTQTFPAKPRTWHRTSDLIASNTPVKKPSLGIPPPHRAPYGKALKVQDTSYIRKGNSLVRNPVSGAVTSSSRTFVSSIDRSRPNTTDRIGNSSVFLESTELPPDGLVTARRSTPIEMPKTPPLPCSSKTSDNDVVYSRDCESSLHVDLSEGTDNEEALKSSDASLNSFKDTETVVNRNLEDPGFFSDGDLLGSDSKRMIYIKRKSNQLIAASKTSQSSLHNLDKATAISSDINYFKSRKNQLIRASSEGNIQKLVDKDSSKSLFQRALHVYSSRNSTKRLSNKVKSQKYSLVWKLGDSKSCSKGADALRSGRLLSHLLPWKRATYWSRKPLSSRKRGAVYVRSGRGFSLRRSKVTSLPGTSLKWSKSMEKRSKKVEELAAQAVAARDSESKSVSSDVRSKVESSIRSLHKLVHGLKLHPGERIFRIGVFRYRMDPSRRTLLRISDEEASDFTASETEKGARKTYVPKRLLIGSDEYIRIGNGNQLVRDPKRRTRILASEKVRWSLHTARMLLAKKRKFCQFFTRFGKCNKGEGKCPFVHDPSKIAVCTKFLNGLCADSNCKLTHKVIPERMPDCSFFLLGLCSNEKCPYRHVNVNPKASICESFLRGYCAEGNECRKKHSYICPEFEASGSCPQGSRCKLYHPKKGKSKKRKALRDQKNAKGRYFGSGLSVVADPETRPIMLGKHGEPNKANSFVVQKELGDFVSLGVIDDEAQEDELMSDQTFLCEDVHLNSQLDDIGELIKPLLILG